MRPSPRVPERPTPDRPSARPARQGPRRRPWVMVGMAAVATGVLMGGTGCATGNGSATGGGRGPSSTVAPPIPASAPSTAATPTEDVYGAADGLGCHRRADGEELVESAVYDYGEGMGYDDDRDDALAVFAGGDGASLGVDGLRREGGGREVRFVDDHGHVQVVVLLVRRDGGWRVESFTACSPG